MIEDEVRELGIIKTTQEFCKAMLNLNHFYSKCDGKSRGILRNVTSYLRKKAYYLERLPRHRHDKWITEWSSINTKSLGSPTAYPSL